METVAVRHASWRSWRPIRPDLQPAAIWALAAGTVLYPAFDSGGYDLIVHSQVAIVVWWVVLLGAAANLLPVAWPTRVAWAAIAVLAAFAAWTAVASTWSLSSERSLQSLSLVGGYLGVLVLSVALNGDRRVASIHTVGAIACAIVLVACFSLASRLDPGLFRGPQQTASFFGSSRLAWPLNYWNGLAAMLALGIPLLLGLATAARRLLVQAAAAAAIPAVVLCTYLTFSRGGAMSAAIAIVAFYAFAPERIPKLATGFVAAGGSAALIAGTVHRHALERGLSSDLARHQGAALFVAIVLICAGVGLAQTGIGLAHRHGTPPRLLVVPRRRAGGILAVSLAVLLAVALAVGLPGKLSHAWQDFKRPPSPALMGVSPARFGSLSGNGRYDYWKVAVRSTGSHVLGGHGPGTFQLVWLPQASQTSYYVQNAHSLYVETLSDTGVVGLALLILFLAAVLIAAVQRVVRSRHESRALAAAAVAAMLAFVVSAAFDWIWQVPVISTAFLLLSATALAPRPGTSAMPNQKSRIAIRVVAVLLSLACLVAIAIPLAATSAVRQSQQATSRGNASKALTDAREATGIESGAASPQIQLALVEELQGDLRDAVSAARRAASDEPANWSTWLVLSRLQAEVGHPGASLDAYLRARALNPRSPLFKS